MWGHSLMMFQHLLELELSGTSNRSVICVTRQKVVLKISFFDGCHLSTTHQLIKNQLIDELLDYQVDKPFLMTTKLMNEVDDELLNHWLDEHI